MERVQVFYEGDVQGVGFRYRVVREAAGRPVTGFVRNLADGRVEMVAEGERDTLKSFLFAIRSGDLGEHIRDAPETWSASLSGFDGFGVRW